ncbi:MAG: IS1595 family transposase [Proteobacteria bacterium]|nr:IS1595 family transposase [Pseudomonadota bacterium]
MDKDIFQNIIALIDDLSEKQRDLVRKALDGGDDLERLISIIENPLATKRECFYCKSENVKKWGVSHGLQRFRCFDCGKTFNALTGSPLARLRKKNRWMEMALALREGLSVRKTSTQCEVSVSTAFRWRHRFLKAAAADKPVKLDGIAEADETYILESFKGQRKLPRPARKRGGKAKKRGLSREQIPVLIVRDRNGVVIDAVLRDQSKDSIKSVLSGKLCKDNILCIDGGKALWGFVNEENIPFKLIPPGKHVHEKNPIFHIQNVNGYHQRLKSWLARFHGVSTKYLANYLGWRRIYEKPKAILTQTAWIQVAMGIPNQQLMRT